MLVTLIIDASHCPRTKAAGYGWWLASTRGKRGGSGPMHQLQKNSTVAEMQAIQYAVDENYTSGLILPGDILLIQTDCTAAIWGFQEKRNVLCDTQKQILQTFKQWKELHKIGVMFKHVRGHTAGDDNRSMANIICDRRALQEMRKLRDEILKAQEDGREPGV